MIGGLPSHLAAAKFRAEHVGDYILDLFKFPRAYMPPGACRCDFPFGAWILFVGISLHPSVFAYKGEIELPTTLYTGDRIELEKGRFEIEIRSEKGLNFLVFLRKGELISLVNGQGDGCGSPSRQAP